MKEDVELGQDQVYTTNLSERIKLKRQTKIICNLDEGWNNYNKLSHLLSLGVDAIEIGSEMPLETKKEIISKVNYFALENDQHIPIIYDLAYYRVYVKQIKETNEDEVKINQGESVLIFHSRQEMYNTNKETRTTITIEEKDDKVNIDYSSKKGIGLIDLAKQIKNFQEEEPKKENRALSIVTEPRIIPKAFTPKMNIHINYGDLTIEVDEINENYIKCIAKNSGIVTKYSMLSVESENHFTNNMFISNEIKLVSDIEEAINLKCNYIVISLIKDPKEEIKQIRELLRFKDATHIKIILKLDSPESICWVDDILDMIDVIYFSRNYLLIKDNLGRLCSNQKKIVNKCNYNSK